MIALLYMTNCISNCESTAHYCARNFNHAHVDMHYQVINMIYICKHADVHVASSQLHCNCTVCVTQACVYRSCTQGVIQDFEVEGK